MKRHVLTPEQAKGLLKALEACEKPVNPLAEKVEHFPSECDGDCENCEDFTPDIPWDAGLPFMMSPFAIDRVEFHNPATIVWWMDGTKTVVRCMDNATEVVRDGRKVKKARPADTYSKEVGLAMCIAKKAYGNTGYFNEIFKNFIPEYDGPEITVYADNDENEICEVVGKGVLRKLSDEEANEVREKFGMDRETKKKVDDGKIKALSDAGWSAEEIAKEMNLHVTTVYNHLKKIREGQE